jgi:hypothetical protein
VRVYLNYLDKNWNPESAIESFHSLLASKGILLANPMGEKEPEEIVMVQVLRTVPRCCQRFDKYGGCCNDPEPEQVPYWTPVQNHEYYEWHTAQQKVVKGRVVVVELTNAHPLNGVRAF